MGSSPGRDIRTYKLRRGRVSLRQQRALDELLPGYGVPEEPEALAPLVLFGRRAPLVLEIGFGMGEATVAMAAADPARDVLAVDVHTPGVGALLHAVHAGGLPNVRVLAGDAVEVLERRLAPGTLDEVRAFFPDPWPKARHAKRRLVAPTFARLVASRLRRGGRLRLATDWPPYAEQMLAVLAAEPDLDNPYGGTSPRLGRPVTRFEAQGLAKGHEVIDVVAVRTSRPDPHLAG